jgi:hypothetical protein
LDAALLSINAIVRRGLTPALSEVIKSISTSIEANIQPVLDDVEAEIVVWAESIGAERHPITAEQANSAMEAYFKGESPLTVPKDRKDIPDSFIFQTILTIAQQGLPLRVIAEDGKINKSSSNVANTVAYKSLQGFIESAEIQTEILELDVVDNLAAIASELRKYEEDSGEFAAEVYSHAGKKIMWRTLHSQSIPDDNHQAAISGYNDPEDIEFDFKSLSYFGSGAFGLPFSFKMNVEGLFYVFKGDYFALEEEKMPSITDHNDHYFQATNEFEVLVSGLMAVNIDPQFFQAEEEQDIEDYLKFSIDSLVDILLKE